MAENDESGSVALVSKAPSESPSVSPSRQSSRKMRSSKSSGSMMKSSTDSPQREVSLYSQKSRNSQVVKAEKPEVPESCECGPDLYSRVLGPTADETILTGLQTVIDLCNKLRDCGNRDEEDEVPEREQDLPERDVPIMKTSKSQTYRSLVSAGFQVNPSIKSATTQTAPYSELVSEMLQTVGLNPEMISKVIQTSFVDERKPSLVSGLAQTSSLLLPSIKRPITENVKTSTMTIRRPSLEDVRTSTEDVTTENAKTQSELIRTRSRQTVTEPEDSGDEHKCVCPPEPPSQTKICKCCKCASGVLQKVSRESRSSEDKQGCVCGSRKMSKCRCDSSESKRSESSVAGDHQPPSEVKYAVAKISKYREFTTFEIMRSTKNPPKRMPKSIEGVFVLKKKNGNSRGEVKGSKSESNGFKQSSKNGKSYNGSKNGSRNGTKNGTLNDVHSNRQVSDIA